MLHNLTTILLGTSSKCPPLLSQHYLIFNLAGTSTVLPSEVLCRQVPLSVYCYQSVATTSPDTDTSTDY